jgi:hypothetical protein
MSSTFLKKNEKNYFFLFFRKFITQRRGGAEGKGEEKRSHAEDAEGRGSKWTPENSPC